MLLNEEECSKIRKIKSQVSAMISERAVLEAQKGKLLPSPYWSDFCGFFRYMMGLSEEYYGDLRLHTYHLDSDNYQRFYFGDPAIFRKNTSYDKLISRVPAKYRLGAPRILGEFGYDFDGCTVNGSIVGFQSTVNTLYLQGVLPKLEGKKGRKFLLEIGVGYGCLAYQIKRILDDATYVIVDLPETLLFSASYLSLALPEKNICLYDSALPLVPEKASSYDFILLPNYLLPQLARMRFDLALNTESFQEMTRAQLTDYLDFIQASCDLLYSKNKRAQEWNRQDIDVTSELSERFILRGSPSPFDAVQMINVMAKSVAYILGLRTKPQKEREEYICVPK